ncbi:MULTISPECIES: TetR family transcriptional regulator [unclassified Streptomyces]|uniref:TetR/AcrR family transcriptional regulator n=1 Tax=unclassified Streptomyces TaxID=2593676 RepID=UPI00081B0536|nr:TetR family transcriptional regulator [Streptomyces sp. BvitLS-983]MYX82674.1 TetR family transcriptional regulator [Streptomyces sp. SID4915]SCD30995.1 transcriptional regulator, TetR family [Streptomyces sp. BvitLS-983]
MPTEPVADGRRARGEETRRRLLDATVRVIKRDGVAGVTHRAVAAEAGVPKSVASYHYPAVDDLLTAALRDSSDAYARDLAALLPEGYGLGDLAAHLTACQEENRSRALAEYELYLQAARRPALRPAAARWTAVLAELAAPFTTDPAIVATLTATLDGLFLQALLRDEPVDAGRVEAAMRVVIEGAAR